MRRLKILAVCLIVVMLCGCGRRITIEKYEILEGGPVLLFRGTYEVTGDQKFSDFKMKLPGKFEVSFDQEAEGAGIETAIDAVRDFAGLIAEGKLVTPHD